MDKANFWWAGPNEYEVVTDIPDLNEILRDLMRAADNVADTATQTDTPVDSADYTSSRSNLAIESLTTSAQTQTIDSDIELLTLNDTPTTLSLSATLPVSSQQIQAPLLKSVACLHNMF